MDIRYLKTLLEVVNGGSLAEAARRQNLTAAAVGQRLKVLENELGTRLVRRSGLTVRPTPACIRMIPRLRSIIADTSLIWRDIADDGLAGPYRLGVISTALADHVPSLVAYLRRMAPHVELSVKPGASAHLFDLLSRNELDAAIFVEPSFQLPKHLKSEVLERQQFAWLNPIESTSIDLPLVIYDKTSWGGELAWRWIEQNLESPKVLCEMDSPETMASLVAAGAGRAILPIWGGLSKMTGIQTETIHDLPKRSLVFVHTGSPIDHACLEFFTA
ncbi:MAG: LysR family transcriptional regulator [Sulfitobacter sp.]